MQDEGGGEIAKKQFYLTPSHPCSYFDDRDAQTLFLDPRDAHSADTYAQLTRIGFRRSGGHLYRPNCGTCSACIPSRVAVEDFRLSRRFRRVLRKNADLEVRIEPGAFGEGYYALYAKYIAGRHRDGDMYPPSHDQYRSFLLAPWARTEFLCAYLDGELISVAVTDVLPHGLSAIYTFFDPDHEARSLGVFSILMQIRECSARAVPHLYLGYWIKDAPKMRYKIDYRPVELLVRERWTVLR